MSADEVEAAKASFQDAIESAEHLQYCEGLKAIVKGEGKGQISARDSARLLGSSFIDKDCNKKPYHNDPRWDYVVGYARQTETLACFIEPHSAYSSEVSKMAKKLDWLQAFLLKPENAKLAALPRQYHWVASGKNKIPRHSRQYKQLVQLRKRQLRGPVSHLEIA